MGKFSGPSVKPGAEVIGDQVPQSTILSDLIAQQKAGQSPEVTPEALAPTEPAPAVQPELTPDQITEQVQREAVPAPAERLADKERVDKFHIKEEAKKRANDRSTDGGIQKRAAALAQNWNIGRLAPSLNPALSIKDGSEPASTVANELPDTVSGAFAATGAVKFDVADTGRVTTTDIDPNFLQLGAFAAENYFADGNVSDDADFDALTDEEQQQVIQEQEEQQEREVARGHNNQRLGRQIFDDYQRMTGNPTPREVTSDQANAIGTVFKEIYARNNPDLVEEVTAPSGQKFYRVTPKGANVFNNSKNFRTKLFPKQHVRPAKAPVKRQLGEGTKYTKATAGALNRPVGTRVLQEAMDNLGTVANVVNPQRMRIALSTLLPALLQETPNADPLTDLFSTINNFGQDKLISMVANAETEAEGMQSYNMLKSKIAQEAFGMSSERKGANFLTYYLQAFQGRIAPQQTHFDPTASKLIRFVTANATPAEIKRGNRQDRNIRQMYAMMLVKGADTLLPEGREKQLLINEKRLEAWGDRLQAVLDQTMTDQQAEAVAQAIQDGVALNSPEFPQVNPLALDPEADAELISVIKSKGEDGPHFIDGVIDFAKYIKAMRAGRPYHSYFNAYMDGKTNGLAANGIQMGNKDLAYKTGVMRSQDIRLLDDGDIRDALADNLAGESGYINTTGFEGSLGDAAVVIYDIADAVYTHRPLNKETTMTFGYGKEAASFVNEIEATINELVLQSEKGLLGDNGKFARDVQAVRDKLADQPDAVGQVLIGPYVQELTGMFGGDTMRARGAMRHAATFAGLLDKTLPVRTYTGYVQEFGGNVSTGIEGANTRRFSVTEDGKKSQPTVVDYETYPTAAAPGKDGKLGKKAGNAAVVGPVQSLDAATVAMTVTGKSWNKLKAASGGNPYIHTIFDAFKVDANGYDVVLEEVNNNWLKANEEWSYLRATQQGFRKIYKDWKDEMAEVPDNALTTEVYPGRDIGLMAKEMMEVWTNEYGMPDNGVKQALKKFFPAPQAGAPGYEQYWENINAWSEAIIKATRAAGYDPKKGMTVKQLKVFNDAFFQISRLDSRFSKQITITDKKKKDLIREIRRSGQKNYQYYAH